MENENRRKNIKTVIKKLIIKKEKKIIKKVKSNIKKI